MHDPTDYPMHDRRHLPMANTKSAIKRMKQSEVRRQRNRATRSNLRSTVKAARAAIAAPGPEARDSIRQAIRTLDRAVTQGLIHRNTAARKTSALAKKLNTLA
jgi:small subunit ribosomal protein S20